MQYRVRKINGGIDMKCRELQFGDWCRSGHGFPVRITNVGDDYAYATFEGFDWELDDKDFKPCAIEITTELLEANGWDVFTYEIGVATYTTYCSKKEAGNYLEWKRGTLSIWIDYEKDRDGVYSDIVVPCKYVHQLQQVLRLAGMTELANNFVV